MQEFNNVVKKSPQPPVKIGESSAAESPCFHVYDESFTGLFASDGPRILLVEERKDRFAHEAGVFNKKTNSVYFTANFQTHDPVALFSVNCSDYTVKELNYPLVVQANGACQYKDGILYCSQGDKKTPSSLVLVDPVTAKSETIIDSFYGQLFNSINDVVVHHSTGDIWFTDPTYGYEQGFRPAPQLPNQVYRFEPASKKVWCVADGFSMCNGLCFSPDYKIMYVTDTGANMAHNGIGDGHQVFNDPSGPATIYAYDVIDKKFLTNRRVFAYAQCGVPDGIKCDEAGNVYSACGDGVHVWDVQGSLLGKIYTGGVVANFCFVKGGMWLFGETRLFYTPWGIKGALVDIEC